MSVLILFFKLLLVTCCLLLINSRNTVLSVLYLVLVFVSVAVLFLFIGIEFIAFILLVVYVGAICILFLFVVMMLNVRLVEIEEVFFNYYAFLSLIGALLSFSLYFIFSDKSRYYLNSLFPIKDELISDWVYNLDMNNVDLKILGELLYTYYFLAFLGCGIMLLVAMVGAIMLTFTRKDKDERSQKIYFQVQAEGLPVEWRS